MNSLPPLISKEKIDARVAELGQQITHDLKGEKPIIIGVLKGSVIFFADLVRNIDLPLSIDFIGASSYGNGLRSSGSVKLFLDLSQPITERHVVLVEDIIDTGNTLRYVLENFQLRKPASLRLCSLLTKPKESQPNVKIDYLGFTVEDRFVVGYGLDAAEEYRNLPYIALYPEGGC